MAVDDGSTSTATGNADSVAWRGRRGPLLAVLAAAALVVLLTLAAGIAARGAYLGSLDASSTLEQRATSASRAHELAPWNAQYDLHSQLLSWWLLGKQQLDRGDYNAAVDTLDAAYRLDIGNAELLALYRRAQETQALETNRKAHLQHGHEGPGGTLRPGDVER